MDGRLTSSFTEPLRASERMVLAWRQTPFARRTWFAVTVAAILTVHGAILAALLWHDDRPVPAKGEDVAVEVVAQMPEAPAPQPPKPPNPPQPPSQQPLEKPATSAPRAQNEETVERDSEANDSRAPKMPAAKVPPAMPPAAPASPPEQQASEAKAEQPKAQDATPPQAERAEIKPDDKPAEASPSADPREAEALDKAPPEPPRRPAQLATKVSPPKPPVRPAAAKLASASSKALPTALPTPLDPLAGTSDLPDYVFAKPQRKRSKLASGSEDNRYLAVIYAMVTQNHEAIALPDGEWKVAVSFQVDGHGDLIAIELTQSSGYREIDAAAVDSVRRAAPFPPPPSGGVTGLVARLSSDHVRAAMARGR